MDYPYRPVFFWLEVTHRGFGLRYVTPQKTLLYLQQLLSSTSEPI